MPAIQSCDPAAHGRTYNTLFLLIEDVSIEVRWTWDGVSVYPDCDGPLVDGGTGADRWAVRVTNTSAGMTHFANTIDKNGTPRTWSIAPGQTATVTAPQAAINGYTLISDFHDLTFTSRIIR